MSSRVCVKNLPKHLTVERFKKHFSSVGEITDVKIMKTKDGRPRQLGFVGFKTVQEAKQAVYYFNNTYLDTSKITVDQAKPIGDSQLSRPWSKYSKGSAAFEQRQQTQEKSNSNQKKRKQTINDSTTTNTTNTNKKVKHNQKEESGSNTNSSLPSKNNNNEEERKNPSLEEFLSLVQPRNKGLLWADNTDAALANNNNNNNQKKNKKDKVEVNQMLVASKRNGQKGQLIKKTHVKFNDDEEADGDNNNNKMESDEESDEDLYQDLPASDNNNNNNNNNNEKQSKAVVYNSAVSDLEYLKSKIKSTPTLMDDSDNEKEEEEEDADDNRNQGEESEDGDHDNDHIDTSNNADIMDIEHNNLNNNTVGNDKEEQEDSDSALSPLPQNNNKKNKNDNVPNNENVDESDMNDNRRLFIRNLSYATTEDDLINCFKKFGEVVEVHIPIDNSSGTPKGIGFVEFSDASSATKALGSVDGNILQGRLLHVLPAKKNQQENFNKQKQQQQQQTSFKAKKEKERKNKGEDQTNWNSLFMNSDAVVSAIAARLKVSKSDILSKDLILNSNNEDDNENEDTSSRRDSSDNNSNGGDNLAVRVSLAETHIINETKKMLEQEGVNLIALGQHSQKNTPRSRNVILVKNIPFSTTVEDLTTLFSPFGTLGKVVLPPARTIALVEFIHTNDAKKAFKQLAYTKFKHLPLYLEWSPLHVFNTPSPTTTTTVPASSSSEATSSQATSQSATTELTPTLPIIEEEEANDSGEQVSLFIKNLNFSTTEATLHELFSTIGPVRSVIIAKKKDVKNPGKSVSMGYGFVEFYKKHDAQQAIKKLQDYVVDGHAISLKFSTRSQQNNTTNPKQGSNKTKTKSTSEVSSKLMIRNIPFEAQIKDIRELFKPFGRIKSARLPKKFDGSSRGFAFVEFITKQDAKNAMDSLAGTHLYGRHLVLEYSFDDEENSNNNNNELKG